MYELLEQINERYHGLGFFFVFAIPAAIIGGILLFELLEGAVADYRRWRRGKAGQTAGELEDPLPELHVTQPESTIRDEFHRPLEPSLKQPFSRHVNRIDSLVDARWR